MRIEMLSKGWSVRMGSALKMWVARMATAAVMAMGIDVTAMASGMPTTGVMGMPGMMAASMGSVGALTMGQRYTLRLHHTHTGEDISIVYRVGDTYLPEAIDKLNYFLRDHRTEDIADYDPQEFDLLHALMARLRRSGGVIDIVCGYRTPESNEFLRTRASATGVAEHSQHMLGKAIDIQVPGVGTLALRNAALAIGAGGVGYYPTSHFVHVDVGPVREWAFGNARYRGVARHHRLARRRG